MRISLRLLTPALTGLLLVAAAGHAQPAADGYTAPRTIYGDPDLQGIWQTMNTAVWNIQDHPAELGIPAGQGVVIVRVVGMQHPLHAAQRQHGEVDISVNAGRAQHGFGEGNGWADVTDQQVDAKAFEGPAIGVGRHPGRSGAFLGHGAL